MLEQRRSAARCRGSPDSEEPPMFKARILHVAAIMAALVVAGASPAPAQPNPLILNGSVRCAFNEYVADYSPVRQCRGGVRDRWAS